MEFITSFFKKNEERSSSGLMYVCGHPGTGKTSIINKILKELQEEKSKVKVFNYNGMVFNNLFEFSKRFIVDMKEKLFDGPIND